MAVQPKVKPLTASRFFADGRSSRPLPEDTVPHGRQEASESRAFPFPITRAVLDRGRERFDIFCSVCHGRTGEGNGMIVQRGFKTPPSFHSDRLRSAPERHYFDVITKGFGTMYSYKDRVPPSDRWAIIAYIRALQFSRRASLSDAPLEERRRLLRMKEEGR